MADQPLSSATDRRLGGPLPHQLANQTRGHLSAIKSLTFKRCHSNVSCGISSRFQLLSPTERQVPHALLTRSPLSNPPKGTTPFDLHVLGTPPAFVLSQDQTLKKLYLNCFRSSNLNSLIYLSSKFYSRIFVGCFRSSYTRFLNNPL